METHNRDYKEKFGKSALKSICGMANTKGGEVIIGISDDGKVKGINVSNENLEKITEKIVGKLGIHPDIEIEEKEGKKILKISVQKSHVPVSLDGKYYERVGNTTREMKSERLKQFFLKSTNWDSLINDTVNFDDIDIESVKSFIRIAKFKGRLGTFSENTDIKVLFEHLGLARDGKLTNAAIMLFGKNPQKFFINTVLRIIRLKNETTPIGDRLIDGNLFDQVIEGEEAIKNFINVRYKINGLLREEIWDYPLTAIREALINALIHRDYFKWNVQTQIKIYDDYIWFYNIGGLPEGINLEQLKKPHSSVPRNPLIVHIFYLAGLIEEMGTGTGRIIENLRLHGLPDPEFKEEMGGFSVYFRKDIYTEEYLRELGLNERQIKAVMYVKERGRITNREYRELNRLSDEGARLDILKMLQLGIFKQIGKGRSVYYVLKK